MAINVTDLRAASTRSKITVAKSLHEAVGKGMKTAFLCHSHLDAPLAKGLDQLLSESGWNVYIDWEDITMPPNPNRETAQKIENKIILSDYFLFLATENSMSSRWCPWEIGYADGKKPLDRIIVVPTSNGYTTHGNEYIELYRRMDFGSNNSIKSKLAVWSPKDDKNGVWADSL